MLYEYNQQPIIFEVKSGNVSINSKPKMHCVSQLYACRPYLCEVRPAGTNESIGLYVRRQDPYQRELVINKPAGLEELATKLWENSNSKS